MNRKFQKKKLKTVTMMNMSLCSHEEKNVFCNLPLSSSSFLYLSPYLYIPKEAEWKETEQPGQMYL